MAESANTSKAPDLLTARNAILVAAVILVFSLVWECIAMLRPNDSGGLGRDSYGTRADGLRGLYETLEELRIPVRRNLTPPRGDIEHQPTFALLGPNSMLVHHEPTYLKAILEWVDQGGRLVIAPSQGNGFSPMDFGFSNHDIFELLEIDDFVELSEEPASDSAASAAATPGGRKARPRRRREYDEDKDEDDLWNVWNNETVASREIKVKATGSLADLASDVTRIAAPGKEFATLLPGSKEPAGTLKYTDAYGDESLLAAVIPRGKGEIIVISDPRLFGNVHLAKADNSILAAQLLSPRGEGVDFDEYYHGLAVRGNSLYLLTRPGFAAATVGILAVIGIVAWRAAVFLGPPLPDVEHSRRDIQEYIHAMGAFFSRGPGHKRFILRETRDGVLRELCQQLHLPPYTADTEKIAAALERRFPTRAAELRKALAQVDDLLTRARSLPKSEFLSAVQRLAGCL
jgi:hypothetical protein